MEHPSTLTPKLGDGSIIAPPTIGNHMKTQHELIDALFNQHMVLFNVNTGDIIACCDSEAALCYLTPDYKIMFDDDCNPVYVDMSVVNVVGYWAIDYKYITNMVRDIQDGESYSFYMNSEQYVVHKLYQSYLVFLWNERKSLFFGEYEYDNLNNLIQDIKNDEITSLTSQ